MIMNIHARDEPGSQIMTRQHEEECERRHVLHVDDSVTCMIAGITQLIR